MEPTPQPRRAKLPWSCSLPQVRSRPLHTPPTSTGLGSSTGSDRAKLSGHPQSGFTPMQRHPPISAHMGRTDGWVPSPMVPDLGGGSGGLVVGLVDGVVPGGAFGDCSGKADCWWVGLAGTWEGFR
jgi:hypothetical protein